MVRRTIVELVDDLDGSRIESGGGGTFSFALEGVSYEVDLTNAHADELRGALSPFIAKARRATGGRRISRGASADNVSEIRAWAKSNGHAVAERGRMPAAVIEAYNATR